MGGWRSAASSLRSVVELRGWARRMAPVRAPRSGCKTDGAIGRPQVRCSRRRPGYCLTCGRWGMRPGPLRARRGAEGTEAAPLTRRPVAAGPISDDEIRAIAARDDWRAAVAALAASPECEARALRVRIIGARAFGGLSPTKRRARAVVTRSDRSRPADLGRIAAGVLAYLARSKDPAAREVLALAEEAGAEVHRGVDGAGGRA